MLLLLADLADSIPALNVFRYITFPGGLATVTAMLFMFIFGPSMIKMLRARQGKGQPIREDGPESHIIAKAGTPTMGGLMILSSLFVSTLLWADLTNVYVQMVMFVTLGFGAIGFYDDYLKVSRQSHKGFPGKIRLALEFVVAGLACWFISTNTDPQYATSLTFPFLKDFILNLGYFFIPFAAFVIVGTGNAVNLTDGLDGLAIVPVMIAMGSFGFIAYLSGNAVFADYLQIH
ncbi:MAG: phospho-N-acetylmuramoyl-pentapeptide-transferase, partial [Lentilitoribacter sp.]